jgi:hypothetical protein
MGFQREILDSEDDGSDFGGGSDLGDNTAAAATAAFDMPHAVPGDETVDTHATVGFDASHSPGTDSTHPSFFQRIYDQHQAAAAAMPDVIPDTAPVGPSASTGTDLSSAPPPAKKRKHQAKNDSSLTSVTDPVPASRKSKRSREAPQHEVIDLTDITPPKQDAASTASDVWDVPSSARSQTATRTYGKRKLAQLSLEQDLTPSAMPDTQDPYAFPNATPPVKNAAGRAAPSSSAKQPPDSSPVLLVPTEEAGSSDGRTRSNRKMKNSFDLESSLPDTAAPSLYVAQSTLTASQKQEYRIVSLSSDAIPETSEMVPPDLLLGTDLYKSSTATTIAYPTPSRVAPSGRLAEIFEGLDGGGFEMSPAQDDFHLVCFPGTFEQAEKANCLGSNHHPMFSLIWPPQHLRG